MILKELQLIKDVLEENHIIVTLCTCESCLKGQQERLQALNLVKREIKLKEMDPRK